MLSMGLLFARARRVIAEESSAAERAFGLISNGKAAELGWSVETLEWAQGQSWYKNQSCHLDNFNQDTGTLTLSGCGPAVVKLRLASDCDSLLLSLLASGSLSTCGMLPEQIVQANEFDENGNDVVSGNPGPP